MIRNIPLIHRWGTASLAIALACGGGSTQQGATSTTQPTSPVSEDGEEAISAPAKPASLWSYPDTQRQDDIADELHGVKVADPYRWLEDVSTPETAAWVKAQDELTRGVLNNLPKRNEIAARFRELLYLDFVSAPYHRAGRYFYSKRFKDKEKSVVYWKEGENGEEKVLFDPNTMSEDGSIALKGYSLSWDGKKVAFKLSQNNADESTMYVRDIATGQDSAIDVISGAKYASAAWMPDNKGFYYEWLPTDPNIPVADRPGYTEIRFHKLGADPAKDEQIFPSTGDPRTFLGADVSRDGRWLFVAVQQGWNKTEIYVKDLSRKSKPKQVKASKPLDQMTTSERVAFQAAERGFVPFATEMDAVFMPQWWQGHFYIYTNMGAPNYRLFKASAKNMAMSKWTELIPERKEKLEFAQVIGNHLVASYMRNATSVVEIYNLDGKLVREVELPGIGTSSGMLGNPDEDDAYFSFTSFTTPIQIYKTSIKSGQTSLWSKLELPIDTSQMVAEQVFYPSKDGTKVSMFIVHRKDMKKDGKNPTLLFGYGGFNVSMTPGFSPLAATWVEKGGIYVLPNLRGGGEYGEDWHKAGMLLKKQNVFDDYIAAAEYLIAQGYTSSEKLAIYGGSNGGLLVGAAMTQRPDLYRAVVCAVPLLDMVRYHLFGSGKTWIPEYGSAEDPEQFQALYGYSPYHKVAKGVRYPALLMLAADSDDRVDPLHARKFTAAVQWANAATEHPVLMRVERNAGHGGADLVRQQVEQSTDTIAFLLWQLGVTGG